MVIVRFHTNAAGLPSGTVRYLKVKNEADCFGILFDRLIIAAHLMSPHVETLSFLIRIFVRHDYGALERARSPILASDLRSLGGIVGVVYKFSKADAGSRCHRARPGGCPHCFRQSAA